MAKAKKIKTNRRSGRRLFKGIVFLAICGTIIAFFVYVPFFTLKEIKLIGAEKMTVEDILKSGDIYIGEPIFELETDKVAKRLSQDLRIETVTVRRIVPDTLEVRLKERTPLATIVCDYGYLDLDKNGKILDSYKNLKEMEIPMITGARVQNKYIGDDVENDFVVKILDFLTKLDEFSLNKISEVAVISSDYIVAYTDSEKPVQIRIGKLEERTDEKAHLVQDFLHDLDSNPHDVEYVDFNYTAPFIKLAR